MISSAKLQVFLILSFVIIIADYFQMLGFVHGASDRVIIPIKQGIRNTAVSMELFRTVYARFPEISNTIEENKILRQSFEELQLESGRLREENIKLRKQLESPLPPSFHFAVASILAVSRYLEIGVGSAEGVKEKMPVVDGNTLIGTIAFVSRHRSSVMLLNDLDAKVAAKTARGVRGTVGGQTGSSIVLSNVLQKDPLILDDQVFTSGEDDLPPDLLIGKIARVSSDDVSVYKQAILTTPIAFDNLHTVFVITSL